MICSDLVGWIIGGVEVSWFGIILVPENVSEWKGMVDVSGNT